MFLHLGVILFTGGLCPSMHHRLHDQGVSVCGGLCPGRSLSGGLCPGGLCLGGLCPGGLCLRGLCPGGLCLGGLCMGVSVQGVYDEGVSVQGVSVWWSLSGGSLSREVVSVRETPPYGNEWVVPILLECFLVRYIVQLQ